MESFREAILAGEGVDPKSAICQSFISKMPKLKEEMRKAGVELTNTNIERGIVNYPTINKILRKDVKEITEKKLKYYNERLALKISHLQLGKPFKEFRIFVRGKDKKDDQLFEQTEIGAATFILEKLKAEIVADQIKQPTQAGYQNGFGGGGSHEEQTNIVLARALLKHYPTINI